MSSLFSPQFVLFYVLISTIQIMRFTLELSRRFLDFIFPLHRMPHVEN